MVSYLKAQKRRVRVTLDMEVMEDFDPRQIDYEKVFNLEPTEKVEVYVEDMDIDW
jgi:predicted component of type VI protein secretion system